MSADAWDIRANPGTLVADWWHDPELAAKVRAWIRELGATGDYTHAQIAVRVGCASRTVDRILSPQYERASVCGFERTQNRGVCTRYVSGGGYCHDHQQDAESVRLRSEAARRRGALGHGKRHGR